MRAHASRRHLRPIHRQILDKQNRPAAKASVPPRLPRFPSIVRDVSLLVDRRVFVNRLMDAAREQKHDYFAGVSFVGTYEAEGIPDRWVVTIPKITIIEQVEYTVAALRQLEKSLGLTDGTLKFEVMIETPQIILDSSGRSVLPRILDASGGRCRGAAGCARHY